MGQIISLTCLVAKCRLWSLKWYWFRFFHSRLVFKLKFNEKWHGPCWPITTRALCTSIYLMWKFIYMSCSCCWKLINEWENRKESELGTTLSSSSSLSVLSINNITNGPYQFWIQHAFCLFGFCFVFSKSSKQMGPVLHLLWFDVLGTVYFGLYTRKKFKLLTEYKHTGIYCYWKYNSKREWANCHRLVCALCLMVPVSVAGKLEIKTRTIFYLFRYLGLSHIENYRAFFSMKNISFQEKEI